MEAFGVRLNVFIAVAGAATLVGLGGAVDRVGNILTRIRTTCNGLNIDVVSELINHAHENRNNLLGKGLS